MNLPVMFMTPTLRKYMDEHYETQPELYVQDPR
jgi:hypothetical protein